MTNITHGRKMSVPHTDDAWAVLESVIIKSREPACVKYVYKCRL